MLPRNSTRQGFTLIELMVMITVFTAMVTIALPPLNNYLRSNQLDTEADRLAADLQYARSIAIRDSRILRFTGADGNYTLTDAVSGDVIRQRDFDGGCTFALNVTADFYPWGMADAMVISVGSCAGTRNLNLLPTGIVEVQE